MSATHSDSPDRVLAHLQGVDAIWDEAGATHTEVSSEADERMVELASQLHQLPGMEREAVEFVTAVEQLVPDYWTAYGKFVALDPQYDSATIKEFAYKQMVALDADLFESERDLKLHVYALGKIARETADGEESME